MDGTRDRAGGLAVARAGPLPIGADLGRDGPPLAEAVLEDLGEALHQRQHAQTILRKETNNPVLRHGNVSDALYCMGLYLPRSRMHSPSNQLAASIGNIRCGLVSRLNAALLALQLLLARGLHLGHDAAQRIMVRFPLEHRAMSLNSLYMKAVHCIS
jgi:hypothetical protein